MTHYIGDGCPTADAGENALHHLDTVGTGSDHATALAGGFDIIEAGRWVRPDNASIVRSDISPRYRATRDYGPEPWASFYTMREAVEWIGPTRRERTLAEYRVAMAADESASFYTDEPADA